MNQISVARGRLLFLGLALLVVLNGCGKNVESLKAEGDVQGLISILEDSDEKLIKRTDAAVALSEIGDTAAVEPLILYLQECAEKLVEVMAKTDLSSGKWYNTERSCSTVIESLGKMGDTRAVEPLIGLLGNTTIRNNVIIALGHLKDSRAMAPLIDLLEDKYAHNAVAQALGFLNDPRAIVPLIETMDYSFSQWDDVNQRRHLHAESVLDLAEAHPETFDTLREALSGLYAGDDGSPYCYKYELGVRALMATQDPRIEIVLMSEVETYHRCELILPYAFSDLYNYDADKLLPLLDSRQPEGFASILILIGKPGTEDALIKALNLTGCSYSLAEKFYNCGNHALKAAALKCAQNKGYQVFGVWTDQWQWGSYVP